MEVDLPCEQCPEVSNLSGQLSQDATIFRTAPVQQMLRRFGRVFSRRIQTTDLVAAAINVTQYAEPAQDGQDEQDHALSDALYFKSAQSSSADVFVSHTWASSRLEKYLALCYYFNLRVAVVAAVIVWLLVVASAFVLIDRTDITDTALVFMLPLVHFPVVVFVLVFLFGHNFVPTSCSTRIWLDKLCIHQTRDDLKAAGVRAVPEFVANSKRFLLLWSESYFERLWCNAEIATFCAFNGTVGVDIMPLWLAPWMLCTMLSQLLSLSLFCVIDVSHVPFRPFFWLLDWEVGDDLLWMHTALDVFLSYSFFLVPAYCFFNRKIRCHEATLSHVKDFKMSKAKCAVESDRPLVEQHIKTLFRDKCELELAASASAAESIEHYEKYVRCELNDCISSQVGLVTRVPFTSCCLPYLPWLFFAPVYILKVTDHDILRATTLPWFWCHVFCPIATELILLPLMSPVTLEGLLMCKNKVRDGLKPLAGLMMILGTYAYIGVLTGFLCYFMCLAVMRSVFSGVVALIFLSQFALHYKLFTDIA